MRVREPGVQREERHLDGEGEGEGEEEKRLRGAAAVVHAVEVGDGERPDAAVVEVEKSHVDDAEEHQQRAGDGEEEELDGGVDAVRAAPHADDEVHRQQGQLEENVEEEEVGGDEDADHRRFHDQEGDDVLLRMFLDGVPAR